MIDDCAPCDDAVIAQTAAKRARRQRGQGLRDAGYLVEIVGDGEEAWFRENGPDAPGLLEHLCVHGASYDAVLFWAFRYAEVFFGLPLVAERDGHEFIGAALERGAAAYLTSRTPVGGTAIEVDNTLHALE